MAAKKVGTLIKEARTNAGMTQEQLARKISGLSASDISLAERDKLNLTQVAGICDAENKASIRVLEKCGFTRTYEGEALYHGEMKPVVKTSYTK